VSAVAAFSLNFQDVTEAIVLLPCLTTPSLPCLTAI
jgi:hypothetical protein